MVELANCKQCGDPIDWGMDDVTGRWIPLEPIATHGSMDRSFVDEDGVLRADHRDKHRRSVNISRLDHKVKARDAEQEQSFRAKVAAKIGGQG